LLQSAVFSICNRSQNPTLKAAIVLNAWRNEKVRLVMLDEHVDDEVTAFTESLRDGEEFAKFGTVFGS